MFNLTGAGSGALYTAYSDHGNEYVLLVNAPLLWTFQSCMPTRSPWRVVQFDTLSLLSDDGFFVLLCAPAGIE
jgi:hypothetical protein